MRFVNLTFTYDEINCNVDEIRTLLDEADEGSNEEESY